MTRLSSACRSNSTYAALKTASYCISEHFMGTLLFLACLLSFGGVRRALSRFYNSPSISGSSNQQEDFFDTTDQDSGNALTSSDTDASDTDSGAQDSSDTTTSDSTDV